MRSLLVIILISFEVVLGFEHYWRNYNGTTPSDAFEDPDSGLILAQISINERCPGLAPAGLNPISKVASTECVEAEVSTTENIKVICSKNPERYYWEWINVDNVNTTAQFVKGGHQGGLQLAIDMYFGKVFTNGAWRIGKIRFNGTLSGCYFFDKEADSQISTADCMILKYL